MSPGSCFPKANKFFEETESGRNQLAFDEHFLYAPALPLNTHTHTSFNSQNNPVGWALSFCFTNEEPEIVVEWRLRDQVLRAPMCFPLTHSCLFHTIQSFQQFSLLERPFTICDRVLLMSNNRFLPLVNAEKKGASSHIGVARTQSSALGWVRWQQHSGQMVGELSQGDKQHQFKVNLSGPERQDVVGNGRIR